MSRPTLASRTALVTTAVAVVTVLIAGALTYSLTRAAAERAARSTLSRLADVARTDLGERRIGARPGLLRVANISVASYDKAGRLVAGQAPARTALTAAEIQQVIGGASISTSRDIPGGAAFVEARPTTDGAVVLAQRRAEARGLATALFRRTLLALVIGLAVAIPAGIALARRLARPLRHAAYAARALATGHRDVRLEPEGPAEVADVAESINTLVGALQYSEARQRDFLLSVSHELRTPLTAISGFAESLADGVTSGADVPAAGQTILAESRRLERLVTDLLDLARLGAADFRIDIAQVDLGGLMRDAAGVWRSRCEAEGVAFRAELPDQPVYAATDPTRIRQIIDGLAENALRVTPAGRPIIFGLYAEPAAPGAPGPGGWGAAGPRAPGVGAPGVGAPGAGAPGAGAPGVGAPGPAAPALAAKGPRMAGVGWPDGTVALQVRDGGPGLTPQDCAVAFERSALYQRYRGVRRVGTGLGLALVYGLATRLGGTAQAGRAPEGGACFTVRIPRTSDLHQPTVPIRLHPAADPRLGAG